MDLRSADVGVEHLASCPLCGGADFTALPTPGHWIGMPVFAPLAESLGLTRCRGCSLVFPNPRPVESKLWEFYSSDIYSCHVPTDPISVGQKADVIMERLAPYLDLAPESPRTLLDYGAGGGGFLTHMRHRGWTARGFEPGQRGVASCRSAGLDVTDNLADLSGEKFTLITLHHVFEHLTNPLDVLDGLRSLLSDTGRLYIEVPNAGSLRARLALPSLTRRYEIDERYRAFPIHLWYYNRSTLPAMLEKAGWSVDATFTLGLGMDEYFTEPEPDATGHQRASVRAPTGAPPLRKRRPIRDAVRNGFLATGLGEHLAVVARAT